MAPVAGGASALAGAGSIGNYKGVMLCNRPFAGVAAAAKGGGDSGGSATGKHAFVTGRVKSEVGFAGKSLQTEKLLRKRVKQETALTRHRKWLADLQLTKEALEEQYMEDLRKKEESKKRFAEREARMRQMTRSLAAGAEGKTGDGYGTEERGSKAWTIGLNGDVDPSSATMSQDCQQGRGDAEHQRYGEDKEGDARPEVDEEGEVGSRIDASDVRAVEKRRKRDGKPCRPMWAMTEAKAQVENEAKHEEELEVSQPPKRHYKRSQKSEKVPSSACPMNSARGRHNTGFENASSAKLLQDSLIQRPSSTIMVPKIASILWICSPLNLSFRTTRHWLVYGTALQVSVSCIWYSMKNSGSIVVSN